MGTFFGRVKQLIQKTEVLQQFCHSDLKWHESACSPILGIHLHHCTQLFKRLAGHLKVSSPFSVSELFEDLSFLSHQSLLHTYIHGAWCGPWWRERWLATNALPQKEWFEEHDYARVGKSCNKGTQRELQFFVYTDCFMLQYAHICILTEINWNIQFCQFQSSI